MSRVVDAFLESAVDAGYEPNADFNGPQQLGVGRFQLTQRNGMRWSTADGFLRPALERANLTVITDVLAQRVVFDAERATGVEFSSDGEVQVVRADREVVLSAGAYGTPQLLLLSGVGPADDLTALGIGVVQDLPVGHGLQDHVLCAVNYLTAEESLLTASSPANLALLREAGRGPLTSNIAEGGGFIQTRSGLTGPDVELNSGPVLFFDEGLGAPRVDGTVIAVCVVNPQSRGQVRLRSAVADAAPRILHNYLTTEDDRRSVIEGLRAAIEIARRPALREVITGAFDAPASDTDSQLLAHARRTAQTYYHPTSTAAIGSVVDNELNVLGLENLRVVDASVMPTVPRGNTNAPTIMVAEKAADLIKAAQGPALTRTPERVA
jgi:choline dehydrogenase-like flavoprotein